MELKPIVKEFMLTPAPSGYEKKMALAMQNHLKQYSDQVHIDRAGNVIAHFPGTDPAAPRVMIHAHMDSIGFVVRKIESNGFIQVDRMGGVPEKVLPGLEVVIMGIDGQLTNGVFGMKSHHTASADEKYKVDLVTNLLIDIGAASDEDVFARGIHVGCPVVYKPAFFEGLNGHVFGTAVDNRCGCAALVGIAAEIANSTHPADIYIAATVQEEFNIRGGVFAARAIKPDLDIGIDVVFCGDTPDLSGKYDVSAGKGPAVGLYNFHGRGTLNGCIAHKGLYMHARKTAEKYSIPLQEFASLGMLTDTAYIQMEGEYIGCLEMGFSTRYTHTPIESACLQDVELLAKLIGHMVKDMDHDFPVGRFDAE